MGLTFNPRETSTGRGALETERCRVADRPTKGVAIGRRFPKRPAFTQEGKCGRRAELDENAVPLFLRNRRLADEGCLDLDGRLLTNSAALTALTEVEFPWVVAIRLP